MDPQTICVGADATFSLAVHQDPHFFRRQLDTAILGIFAEMFQHASRFQPGSVQSDQYADTGCRSLTLPGKW